MQRTSVINSLKDQKFKMSKYSLEKDLKLRTETRKSLLIDMAGLLRIGSMLKAKAC